MPVLGLGKVKLYSFGHGY